MIPTMQPRRPVALLAVGLLVSTLACFDLEEPVRERMQIRFVPGGGAVVTVAVTLRDFEDKKLAQERVEEARKTLMEERDLWSRRFEAMGPEAERLVREKSEGRLRKVIRIGVIGDGGKKAPAPETIRAGLRRLFADSLVNVAFEAGEGRAELAFHPSRGSFATLEQRDRLNEEMDRWTSSLAGYLAAVGRVYAHLESRPDRAEICLGKVFADLPLPGDLKERLAGIATDEEGLVDAVHESMGEVQGILSIPEGEARSHEELSRIVYDPFPAPLTVQAPWPILEVEGFEPAGARLTVPGLSLWKALVALEGRWLSPDPLMIYFEHQGREKQQAFDFGATLRLERRIAVPSAAEIRRAIEERLRPAAVYRVTWDISDDAAPEDQSLGWGDFTIED
jgi:hypothetical protein